MADPNQKLDDQKKQGTEGIKADPRFKENAEAKAIDLPPYHTAETFDLAKKRKEEQDKKGDQPYEFAANGYEVKQRKAGEQETSFADEGGFVYDVTGNDLPLRTYGNRRDAEVFCETHAPHFAQMPATMPSV